MRFWSRWFPPVFACLIAIAGGIPNASASDAIASAGDILQFVLPAAAVGMTLALPTATGSSGTDFSGKTEGWWDRQGALEFGESAGATLAVTYGLKYTVSERRPNGGRESFPSAHTSISVSAAEFIRKRYGWEYGIPAYALAGFVGYSRVEAREHYPHDVIAGAAIGFASSFLLTKPYKGWKIEAEGGYKYYGIRLSRSF
jgi:membrane-associated phospholipid phosphatase